MKAILEFDFDKEDSDDRSSFEDAINGTKWKMFCWHYDQWLRKQTKYASDDVNSDYLEALYDARDQFHQMLSQDNLNLD